MVTVNQVAADPNSRVPVSVNTQQAFNAPDAPWLTLFRNAVFGDGTTVDDDNAAITAILGQ